MGKKKPKSGWGGKRPGAGRPRKYKGGRTVVIAITVAPGLLDRIDQHAADLGLSRSEAIGQLCERSLAVDRK